MPFVLVGYEVFPLSKHLMKPFPRTNLLSPQNRIFNYRLSHARWTIESAFGMRYSQWRVFYAPLPFHLGAADKIVAAAICLHNFIIDTEPGSEEDDDEVVENDNLTDQQRTPTQIRDLFAAYFNGVGAVPWQDANISAYPVQKQCNWTIT